MNKIIVLIVSIVFFSILVLVFFFQPSGSSEIVISSPMNQNIMGAQASQARIEDNSKPVFLPTKAINVATAPDAQALLEQKRWELSRGYDNEEVSNLRKLGPEELMMLVEQGNNTAMRVIGNRSFVKSPNRMLSFNERAIVNGNLPALLSVAVSWSNPYVANAEAATTFKVAEDPSVNTLALVLAAQLRGDNIKAPELLDQTMGDYIFSEEQIAESCAAAHIFISRVEAKRLESGLPRFDNSPSPLGMDYSPSDHTAATCGK